MAFTSRILALAIIAASAIPFAAAHQSCSGNTFSHSVFGTNLCISLGGTDPSKGPAPSGKSCPSDYFWHKGVSCCVPSAPSAPPTPSCSGSSSWSLSEQCCTPSSPSKPSTPAGPPKPSGSSAPSCKPSEFSWTGLKGQCCLPNGGHPNPPSPPSGSSCPSNWYWHSDQGCCVPSQPSSPTPSCPPSQSWNLGEQCCKPGGSPSTPPKPSTSASPPKPSGSPPSSCKNNEFSWPGLKGQCCLPHGGHPNPPSPPSGSSCPPNWYWNSDQGCCVPSHPSPPAPSCPPSHSWNIGQQCCKPGGPSSAPPSPTSSTPTKPNPSTTPGSCDDNSFLWQALTGKICIPHGGHPSPPSPPSGSSCPPTWYWHLGQGCCVPQHPSPPAPTCPPNSWWGSQCCKGGTPPPKPSGHSNHWKRSQKKRSTGLCPAGLTACPIPKVLGDYECVDTTSDLESCGGCGSIRPEFDCTAIEGARNVGCNRGVCKVHSCEAGYKVSQDGTFCDKLS